MRYVHAESVADELLSSYGHEIDIWDIVRMSARCLKRLGAFALRRKIYQTTVNNFCVLLPPDAYKARGAIKFQPNAITDMKMMIVDGIEMPPQIFFVEPVEETETLSPELLILKPNYIDRLRGEPIDYVDNHPVLNFNETDVEVIIEYSGLKTSSEGVPMVPEEASEACMFFCLFTITQAAYLAQKAPRAIMLDTERWKDQAMARARAKLTMDSLNSNERDKLMNIMVSMDRKAFNIPS